MDKQDVSGASNLGGNRLVGASDPERPFIQSLVGDKCPTQVRDVLGDLWNLSQNQVLTIVDRIHDLRINKNVAFEVLLFLTNEPTRKR